MVRAAQISGPQRRTTTLEFNRVSFAFLEERSRQAGAPLSPQFPAITGQCECQGETLASVRKARHLTGSTGLLPVTELVLLSTLGSGGQPERKSPSLMVLPIYSIRGKEVRPKEPK